MKKRIVVIILILFIIFFSGYFLIKNNDSLFNNTGDASINNTNISKNITSDTANLSKVNDDLNKSEKNSMQNYKSSHKKSENKSKNRSENNSENKSREFTEKDIRKIVTKGVWWPDGEGGSTQDVRIGKIHKLKNGNWLVPAFDKKTGKFICALYVGSTGGYFGGIESYSKYQEIISGKYDQTDSNKHNKGYKPNPVEDIPDSSDFYVLAKDNPNPYQDSVISDEFCSNLEEPIILDSNPITPIVESDTESNSTT